MKRETIQKIFDNNGVEHKDVQSALKADIVISFSKLFDEILEGCDLSGDHDFENNFLNYLTKKENEHEDELDIQTLESFEAAIHLFIQSVMQGIR